MSRSVWLLCLFLLHPAAAQEGGGEEIPVAIEEVDVVEAIREFKAFEQRLEKYRVAVSEGQKAASEIGAMLNELKSTATEENGHNEAEILRAIEGYVDGVIGKQSELVDFLQSQRYRISYYANKVAAAVRPEDVAQLFGTQEGNLRRMRARTEAMRDASRAVADFLDTLSPREFNKASFQPLPGMSAAKRRRLQELQLRYQNAKNGVAIAESRLRLVRQADRTSRRHGRGRTVNVDLILAQMFGALDRIRLQLSSDLLYLESFLAQFETSARTHEIVRALQQLISLQGGLEGPSPGLANVLDWLEESSVRKLSVNDELDGVSEAFPRSSDLLREAYGKAKGTATKESK